MYDQFDQNKIERSKIIYMKFISDKFDEIVKTTYTVKSLSFGESRRMRCRGRMFSFSRKIKTFMRMYTNSKDL